MALPSYYDMMPPTVRVLEELGGSGTNQEIAEGVSEFLDLSEEEASQLHNPEKSSQSELEYRLAWARTYLKKYGLIDNSERGVWAFTDKYQRGMDIDPEAVVEYVRGDTKKSRKKRLQESPEPPAVLEDWRTRLHKIVLSMKPDGFERLSKRLLREIGFVHVEVTGKSGDGGIDGKGIVKIQNVLSYHVVFQCKRYKGSVGPAVIRDFRGAMMGRADKGIIITTGTFTPDAIKEASRDGASPIDLIDGDELMDILKDFRLGVKVEMIEDVTVDGGWFEKV